jgi:hypothetical protein
VFLFVIYEKLTEGIFVKVSYHIMISLAVLSSFSLNAMQPNDTKFFGPAASFNSIVKRAQWHFNNTSWLASDEGLQERNQLIYNLLAEQDLSIEEFLDLFEAAFEYFLMLHMRWKISRDPIALRVRDEVFIFFKGFRNIRVSFLNNTKFLQDAPNIEEETSIRLCLSPEDRNGLKYAFWSIFTEENPEHESSKAYAIAYIQTDLLKILDDLAEVDNFGVQRVETFGRIVAQLILLIQEFKMIALVQNVTVARVLSEKTIDFLDIFMRKTVQLCSGTKN